MSAYKALRPLLFRFEPERIHDRVGRLLRYYPSIRDSYLPALQIDVAGITFPSPVGLAAGFDKDARYFPYLFKFGFGAVEVGTLTPRPQAGNPGPRIFRFPASESVVNRMGFPNCGLPEALGRIVSRRLTKGRLGVNIGANKDSADRIADYVQGYRVVSGTADYVTVNVSSPNTPGLRTLESGQQLRELLHALDDEISVSRTPVFLKVSPDLSEADIDSTSEAILQSKVSAVIVGNTTIHRPANFESEEVGGLSGKPLASISTKALELFSERLAGKLPIVSVGGIFDADDAYDRIKKGASLLQLYTGFIYEGPGLVHQINRGLAARLRADGFAKLAEAVGVERLNSRRPRITPPRQYAANPSFAGAAA